MENKQKLLVICGPTATGKTSLALRLARKFNGEIVSADSRQVYRGMNIGTGKDLPVNAEAKSKNFGTAITSKLSYYEIDGVKVFGYDLVDPKSEFSVSRYLKIAPKIISEIIERKHLPILAGGTGLYIKGVVDGIETVNIPKNTKLRDKLKDRSAGELFESLAGLNSSKAASLNSSDRKNPRRLVRAIEVSQFLIDHKLSMNRFINSGKYNVYFVGLTAPKEFLDKKIDARVDDRVEKGIKKEVDKLLNSGVSWKKQSMMSLGYRQWEDYFEGAVDEKHAIDRWKREEKKYAKRQITWFKKDKRIKWFDITAKNYPSNVEKIVKKWYDSRDVSKN